MAWGLGLVFLRPRLLGFALALWESGLLVSCV